jgi:hypothetical protein
LEQPIFTTREDARINGLRPVAAGRLAAKLADSPPHRTRDAGVGSASKPPSPHTRIPLHPSTRPHRSYPLKPLPCSGNHTRKPKGEHSPRENADTPSTPRHVNTHPRQHPGQQILSKPQTEQNTL